VVLQARLKHKKRTASSEQHRAHQPSEPATAAGQVGKRAVYQQRVQIEDGVAIEGHVICRTDQELGVAQYAFRVTVKEHPPEGERISGT